MEPSKQALQQLLEAKATKIGQIARLNVTEFLGIDTVVKTFVREINEIGNTTNQLNVVLVHSHTKFQESAWQQAFRGFDHAKSISIDNIAKSASLFDAPKETIVFIYCSPFTIGLLSDDQRCEAAMKFIQSGKVSDTHWLIEERPFRLPNVKLRKITRSIRDMIENDDDPRVSGFSVEWFHDLATDDMQLQFVNNIGSKASYGLDPQKLPTSNDEISQQFFLPLKRAILNHEQNETAKNENKESATSVEKT